MNIEPNPNDLDAIVIGGSYAGLSAALQLARARCRVTVIDAGLRRNRFAATSHGFLGRDGQAAAATAAEGKGQAPGARDRRRRRNARHRGRR